METQPNSSIKCGVCEHERNDGNGAIEVVAGIANPMSAYSFIEKDAGIHHERVRVVQGSCLLP